MLTAFLFDDGLPELSPLTDLRACFDVRTGALTTYERLCGALGLHIAGVRVPQSLAALTSKRHSAPVNITVPGSNPVLLINGRCALPHPQIRTLSPGESLVEEGNGSLIAAMIAPERAQAFLDGGGLQARATTLPAPALLSRPRHVRRFRDEALKIDLDLLETKENGALTSTQEPRSPRRFEPDPGVLHIGGTVVIHSDAKVYPGVTLDS